MTCGHCAAAISRAIRKGSPQAVVKADPDSKIVIVTGGGDYEAVTSRVAAAGFTPKPI